MDCANSRGLPEQQTQQAWSAASGLAPSLLLKTLPKRLSIDGNIAR